MEIVVNKKNNESVNTIFFEKQDACKEIFKKFYSTKEPLEARIFAINE